jgi:hypothetical protein
MYYVFVHINMYTYVCICIFVYTFVNICIYMNHKLLLCSNCHVMLGIICFYVYVCIMHAFITYIYIIMRCTYIYIRMFLSDFHFFIFSLFHFFIFSFSTTGSSSSRIALHWHISDYFTQPFVLLNQVLQVRFIYVYVYI